MVKTIIKLNRLNNEPNVVDIWYLPVPVKGHFFEVWISIRKAIMPTIYQCISFLSFKPCRIQRIVKHFIENNYSIFFRQRSFLKFLVRI